MSWESLPGQALDVGVDGQGVAWVVGTDNEVHRWIEDTGSWRKINIDTHPKRISCGRMDPIVCGEDGGIFRFDVQSETWSRLPGGATDVAGESYPDGSDAFAIVGTTPVGDYGNGIYKWSNGKWRQLPGAAWWIGGAINPWIMGGDGIYQNISDSAWKKMNSSALDIAKYGKHVWRIAPSHRPDFRDIGVVGKWDWAKMKWIEAGLEAKAIAVGGNGVVWAVDGWDNIWRLRL